MPDKDGYPTEEELKTIREWDFEKTSAIDLIEYIRNMWWQSEWGVKWGFKLKGKKVITLELHTGGWSGNEDIVNALSQSMFWHLYWEKSCRGGHHYFTIKKLKEG